MPDRREFLSQGLAGLGLGASRALPSLFPVGRRLDRRVVGPPGAAGRITILQTADIHGQLEPHDEFFWENDRPVFRRRGGFGTLKTMVAAIRAENPGQVYLIDGGDCFQGSAVASLSKGAAIVPLVNRIGYDLMLPGNWEVVYGKHMMLRDFEGYRAAKACANMFDSMTGRLLFPPFQIWSVAGIKIGFIGYNDPLTSIRQSPAYSRGIRFGTPEQSLAKYVTILRRDHGCALVAVVAHMGLAKQLDLANRPFAEGVDYILGADTHERIRQPLAGRFARVTEPGAFGSFLGRLDLVVEEGRIREESYTLLEVDPETTRADPETEALVAAARAPYQDTIGRVIGTTRTPLFRYYVVETPMDNLITDALMWRFGTDIVASNGFRFGPPLVPPDGGLAEITIDYLWSMLPIDSEVKRAEVTGRQVADWLEQELENAFAADPTKRFGGWFVRFKGMTIRFRAKAAMGSRLEQVLVGDQPLDLGRVYSLLACEREGDPDNVLCRMKQVKRATRVDVRLHDVLVNYLARFSPVSPVIEGRAVATDVNLPLLSQVDVLNYQFR